jgi:hypothetical protein
MQTKETLQKFIDQFEFNDWKFHLRFKNEVPYLQIKFMATDNMNPEDDTLYEQACRKWMLSYHMTDEEVVTTAWKAVEAAVLHEAREQFKWKGEPIYRPHIDPQALWDVSRGNKVQKREEIKSSWEGDVDRMGGSFSDKEIIESLREQQW